MFCVRKGVHCALKTSPLNLTTVLQRRHCHFWFPDKVFREIKWLVLSVLKDSTWVSLGRVPVWNYSSLGSYTASRSEIGHMAGMKTGSLDQKEICFVPFDPTRQNLFWACLFLWFSFRECSVCSAVLYSQKIHNTYERLALQKWQDIWVQVWACSASAVPLS